MAMGGDGADFNTFMNFFWGPKWRSFYFSEAINNLAGFWGQPNLLHNFALSGCIYKIYM